MRILMRAAVGFGGFVAVVGLTALAAVGCSGDDSTTPQDSGTADVTTDVRADVSPLPDTGTDAADGGSDASDSSASDVQVDAPALTDYPRAVSRAWCSRLQQCCLIPTGSFDMQYCINSIEQIGGINADGLSLAEPYLDGGNVQYDSNKAARCLAEVGTIPCGIITSAALINLRNDCFAAIAGKIAPGGACGGSIECTTANYCAPGSDGGACAPILAAGATCSFNEACTYRGTGAPSQYCDVRFNDAGTHTCLAQKDLDAGCGNIPNYNQECKSNVCVAPGVCANSNVFSDPGVSGGECDRLTVKDAGGGG